MLNSEPPKPGENKFLLMLQHLQQTIMHTSVPISSLPWNLSSSFSADVSSTCPVLTCSPPFPRSPPGLQPLVPLQLCGALGVLFVGDGFTLPPGLFCMCYEVGRVWVLVQDWSRHFLLPGLHLFHLQDPLCVL